MKKLPKPIKFDWNKGNLNKNWHKHQVEFKEIEEVFFNKPIKIFRDVRHSRVEERYYALGVTNQKRQLSLVFTIRESKIRVISARNQSSKERKIYEEK